MSKGYKGARSSNDQRSDSLNPNNPASKAAADNRADQLNPTSPAYKTSRGSSTTEERK